MTTDVTNNTFCIQQYCGIKYIEYKIMQLINAAAELTSVFDREVNGFERGFIIGAQGAGVTHTAQVAAALLSLLETSMTRTGKLSKVHI